MFSDYRVVCVTPAGRRRYLEVLAPQILSSPIVDEYQLWRNTTDASDIRYIHEMKERSAKVSIIEPQTHAPGPSSAICQFFRNCVDQQTIYIRFDDDIVYLEPDFFEKFLRFRVANPDFFLVFPNIVNNAICTYLQVLRGLIEPGEQVHPWCMDQMAWLHPHFSEQLHRLFLQCAVANEIHKWYFGPKLLALTRFSINCMAWFGKDFGAFQGQVPEDEEEWLSVIKPSELMRANCIFGDVIVSHFAFYTQREHLDTTDLLQCYSSLTSKNHSARVQPCNPPVHRDIWVSRLLRAIEALRLASEKDLKNADFVADQIRSAGLALDLRFLYGNDNRFMNIRKAGLWQNPMQLARCLVQLSRYKISTAIDIGTYSGWTTAFIAAYLLRFNADLHVTTVDVENSFDVYPSIKELLPIHFQLGKTSNDFDGQRFDFAFIDGNHDYASCQSDYEAVGQHAPITMLHDINDKYVMRRASLHGGVPRLWAELRSTIHAPDEVFEFLDHSDDERIMGIGLIVRAGCPRRADNNSAKESTRSSPERH